MAEIAAPHDRFFRTLLGRPGVAGALLRERLPAALAARLADDPPEPVDGTFIDPEQREHRTDGLFRARLRDGGELLLYLLVEHKSRRDPRIGLQLLRYLTRILERAEAESGGRGPLPAVVPLVVYHGAEPWDGPGRFAAMVAADDGVRPHLLDFPYTIVDLGRIADAELSGMALLRFGLRLLKHAVLGTDPRELVDEATVAVLRADPDFFMAALRYMIRSYRNADRPAVTGLVRRVRADEETGEMAARWVEDLLNEGEARGIAKGEALGIAKGRAETLVRLLRRRFGTVPEAVIAAVHTAPPDQVDQWLDNFVDAPTLGAVFAMPRPN